MSPITLFRRTAPTETAKAVYLDAYRRMAAEARRLERRAKQHEAGRQPKEAKEYVDAANTLWTYAHAAINEATSLGGQ